MRLIYLLLLLIVKVCGLSTVVRDLCPPLPHWELSKPLKPTDSYRENQFQHYQCVDGYVRKAGTSAFSRCKRVDEKLQWIKPTLQCILIPTMIEPSTTHKRTPSLTTHLSVPTERVSPRPTTPSSIFQTLHPVTETQEVITTVTVTTTIIDDITSVPVDKSSAVTSVSTKTVSPVSDCVSNRAPISSEDPVDGGLTWSSATAIYAGVGGVVVTILPAAAVGVLLFWRRKRMQRVDLSTTPAELISLW